MAYSSDGKVLNLTSRVDKETGELNWTAPEGKEWKLVAAFLGKTFQKVKRAAPGGEGYVMNHFSKKAVANYFSRFDRAFASSGAPAPGLFSMTRMKCTVPIGLPIFSSNSPVVGGINSKIICWN